MDCISLFDGMSCAQIAMQHAGWRVTKYIASEIDKHAITVTQANYPETIQIGDVTEIDTDSLPHIDALFAGSPCQGFSKAGKGLNFEDPRSALFWHFVRIKNALQKKNPDLIWLLENVDMIQEWEDIISKAVGIMPVKINSSLVSAQNRVRLYWTNIGAKRDLFGHLVPGIEQPKDLGLTLKDVLEDEVDERYYISEAAISRLKSRHEHYRPQINPRKTGTVLSGNQSGKNTDNGTTYVCHSGYGRTGGKKQGGTGPLSRNDGKTYALDTNPQNNKLELVGGTINFSEFKANKANKANNIDSNYLKGHDNHGARTVIQVNPSTESGGVQPYQQNRVYSDKGLMPALSAELSGRNNIETGSRIRRLTPVECERLQGVPDNYTAHVSDTQRYKMLGNGWQIDTIVHILKHHKRLPGGGVETQ